MPSWVKGRRAIKPIPVAPIHELLEAEMEFLSSSGDAHLGVDVESDWSDLFDSHKLRYIPNDDRPTIPVCFYVDGIKWTRAHGPGRADSLVAITAYSMVTNRRHLVAALSKKSAVSAAVDTGVRFGQFWHTSSGA